MIRWLLLMILWMPLACAADDSIEVFFELQAPGLDPNSSVWITGGAAEIGYWRPDGAQLTHQGDDRWSVTLRLSSVKSLEYKYTLGDWERQAADADGRPLPNFATRLTDGQVVQDQVAAWTDGFVAPVPQGQVTGEVIITKDVPGQGLLPRDLHVWLPPGYHDDTDRRYPVLYMHDAQNLFDPATSTLGIDWAVDETVTRLVAEGAIEPMIVVGLTSTDQRTADYSPGPNGEAYMAFLVDTIKPRVDAEYRTRPDPAHTLVGGSSMGGLISCMLGWRHPEVFGAALCFSPAFRAERLGDWLTFFTESGGEKRPVFFYLDNGGIGLEEVLQPGIDDMLAFLEAEGYVEGEDFAWVLDLDATHSEGAWAERFPRALLMALEGAARRR